MIDDDDDIEPEDVVMPFGRHKGRSLGDVARAEPTYLAWALSCAGAVDDHEGLRDAIEALAEDNAEAIAKAADASYARDYHRALRRGGW